MPRSIMIRNLLVSMGLSVLIACTGRFFPGAGPSRGDIEESAVERGGDSVILPINERIVDLLAAEKLPGFPGAFFNAPKQSYETFRTGDSVQIRVWENSDNGVFATLGARVTDLPAMKVDEGGKIFVPYVGEIRVVGKTPEELRNQITKILEVQTPEPQVEVSRFAGRKGSITVMSNSSAAQIALNEGNLTLLDMMAQNGGVGAEAESTKITLKRGELEGVILGSELYDNPRYDVALRDNDRIFIENDPRYYRVLGALSSGGIQRFQRPEVSLLDVASGVLSSRTSDPTGIFVFRILSPEDANRVTRSNKYRTPQRFVFTVDISELEGIFLAEKFMLRHMDTVYITEAPLTAWARVIGTLTSGLSTVGSVFQFPDRIRSWTE